MKTAADVIAVGLLKKYAVSLAEKAFDTAVERRKDDLSALRLLHLFKGNGELHLLIVKGDASALYLKQKCALRLLACDNYFDLVFDVLVIFKDINKDINIKELKTFSNTAWSSIKGQGTL